MSYPANVVAKMTNEMLEMALHCMEYAYDIGSPMPQDVELFAAALEEIKKRERSRWIDYSTDPYVSSDIYDLLIENGFDCYPPWGEVPS